MRLKQLQCLIRIAEVGSLHEAARREGITQPALSKMISTLEEEVGASLLLRSTRGATLTEAGRATATRARVICAEARRIVEDAHELTDGEGTMVQVGITAAGCLALLSPVLAKFRVRLPRARVKILDSSFDAVYTQLRNSDLDFAICPLSATSSGRDLDASALFATPMTPVCAAHHRARGVSSLSELMGELWTWPEDADGGSVSDTFRHNNLEKPHSFICDSFAARLQLILASDAIAFMPVFLLESPFLKGRIVPIHVRERISEGRYYLFRLANSPLTRQAEILATYFKEQAEVVRTAAAPATNI